MLRPYSESVWLCPSKPWADCDALSYKRVEIGGGDVIKIKHILTEKLEWLVIEGEAKRPDLGLDWGPPPPTMDGPFLEDLKFLFGEAKVQDLQQDDCWEYDETQVINLCKHELTFRRVPFYNFFLFITRKFVGSNKQMQGSFRNYFFPKCTLY